MMKFAFKFIWEKRALWELFHMSDFTAYLSGQKDAAVLFSRAAQTSSSIAVNLKFLNMNLEDFLRYYGHNSIKIIRWKKNFKNFPLIFFLHGAKIGGKGKIIVGWRLNWRGA